MERKDAQIQEALALAREEKTTMEVELTKAQNRPPQPKSQQ